MLRPLCISSIKIFALCLLLARGCYKEVEYLPSEEDDLMRKVFSIDHVEGMLDENTNRIFFTIPGDTLSSFTALIDYDNYNSISFNGMILEKNRQHTLGSIIANHNYELIARGKTQTDTFNVLFTTLPLLHISSNDEIRDEPKVLASLLLNYTRSTQADRTVYQFRSTAGIEIRGASSMRYDKVSLGLELWKNNSRDDYKAALLGMRPCEDWILDAMYIDDLKMRNKISYEIWEQIAKIPEEDNLTDIYPGIKCAFIEVLINNEYAGLYTLNEKLDEKLINLSTGPFNGESMYKAVNWGDGSTKFEFYSGSPPNTFIWDGWEQIYPSDFAYWNPLDELRRFIVLSTDEEFKSQVGSYIDIDNAMNYYLLINLILGYDNTGKNTFLSRYSDQSRFFIIPWDIEASWGLAWNRDRNAPNGLASNNLYTRLQETNADDFNDKLRDRWLELRKDKFSEDKLISMISGHYERLKISGTYEREQEKWKEFIVNPEDEFIYISNWVHERLIFLDNNFN